MRNRTSDLRIPRSDIDALSLNHSDSTISEVWEFFLCPTRDKTKYIFHYFFTELKTYHLSHPIARMYIDSRGVAWFSFSSSMVSAALKEYNRC